MSAQAPVTNDHVAQAETDNWNPEIFSPVGLMVEISPLKIPV